jgi:uncharacterized protein (TIGR03435 family)
MHRWTAIPLLAVCAAYAQELRFDVAWVRALPGPPGVESGIEVHPTSVRLNGVPLAFMIRWAYGLHPYQQGFEISGPPWLEPGLGCVWYNIEGKTERPVPAEQLRLMLRTLLKERFALTFHGESKEMTVCIISTAKDGPKLQGSEQVEMSVSRDSDVLHFRGAPLSRLDEWLYH